MNLKHTLVGCALLAGALGAAHADTLSFNGDTTGAPVFNRPISEIDVSDIGTAVAYHAYAFSVTVSGVYTFLAASDGWDDYTVLYQNAFNPADPTANLVGLNDDIGDPGEGLSGFLDLVEAGTPYVFVTTGFYNESFGKFSATISGPGQILPVPEPATYGMILAGLGVLGWARRRSLSGKS